MGGNLYELRKHENRMAIANEREDAIQQLIDEDEALSYNDASRYLDMKAKEQAEEDAAEREAFKDEY